MLWCVRRPPGHQWVFSDPCHFLGQHVWEESGDGPGQERGKGGCTAAPPRFTLNHHWFLAESCWSSLESTMSYPYYNYMCSSAAWGPYWCVCTDGSRTFFVAITGLISRPRIELGYKWVTTQSNRLSGTNAAMPMGYTLHSVVWRQSWSPSQGKRTFVPLSRVNK